jgi:hypothetical protein
MKIIPKSEKIRPLIIFLVCSPCAAMAWFTPISLDARLLIMIILGLFGVAGLFFFIKEIVAKGV